jgi:hypothetical protein
MRLQLIAAVLCAGAAVARAEPPPDLASATMRVYADDDHLTVLSPAAHAQVTTGRLTGDVDAAIDSVSAASVDVLTSASPRAFHERRLEAGLGGTAQATPSVALQLGALASHEHDYDAIRVGAGAVTELAARNTTIEVRARLGRARATDVSDPSFVGHRTSAGALVVITQLIDRRTVADLTIDGSLDDGWQGSPYRRVWIADPVMQVVTGWREATPARRLALAAAVRLRRALTPAWFAAASARGYVDEWAVHSATASLALRVRTGALVLGVEARGYLQDGASFWLRRQPDAAAPPRYRTADRTLGPMATAALELTGDRAIGAGGQRVSLAIGGMQLWFFDNAAQARRRAATFTLTFTTPL